MADGVRGRARHLVHLARRERPVLEARVGRRLVDDGVGADDAAEAPQLLLGEVVRRAVRHIVRVALVLGARAEARVELVLEVVVRLRVVHVVPEEHVVDGRVGAAEQVLPRRVGEAFLLDALLHGLRGRARRAVEGAAHLLALLLGVELEAGAGEPVRVVVRLVPVVWHDVRQRHHHLLPPRHALVAEHVPVTASLIHQALRVLQLLRRLGRRVLVPVSEGGLRAVCVHPRRALHLQLAQATGLPKVVLDPRGERLSVGRVQLRAGVGRHLFQEDGAPVLLCNRALALRRHARNVLRALRLRLPRCTPHKDEAAGTIIRQRQLSLSTGGPLLHLCLPEPRSPVAHSTRGRGAGRVLDAVDDLRGGRVLEHRAWKRVAGLVGEFAVPQELLR